ncbi:MAG TPA: hypothetical protein VKZ49_15680 [Polyangiaceae bacterium]|nr:hypothetical protein [Polyangiaceae bacterium]
MDRQRQRSGRKRRRQQRPGASSSTEPILIAARRPGAARTSSSPRSMIAASASPRRADKPAPAPLPLSAPSRAAPVARRVARIVELPDRGGDERERERLRLLDRLLGSEGRAAISKAAEELVAAGFELPSEQRVQLQLLEHADEARARDAIAELQQLLRNEPPIKRPVLDQRLRRLEEHADEALTRQAAAELRRALRGGA